MRLTCRLLPLLLMLALLAGCPPRESEEAAANPAVPTAPLPAQGRLLEYAGLRLGMTNMDIAQAYNAPDGRGDGFRRVIQDFDGVQHHIVKFDTAATEPPRKLVLALLRDELYQVVDRRDALTAEQAGAWRAELVAAYGEPAAMTIGEAQWIWGPENGVQLTFTQDNATPEAMSAHVMLVYEPYETAAHSYLEAWQRAHPDYQPQELPF